MKIIQRSETLFWTKKNETATVIGHILKLSSPIFKAHCHTNSVVHAISIDRQIAYVCETDWMAEFHSVLTLIVQFRVHYDRWIKEVKTHFLQGYPPSEVNIFTNSNEKKVYYSVYRVYSNFKHLGPVYME